MPIQRLELPVDRIPMEMENVRRNVLKQLPQSDFDRLVQQAAQAREAERDPPRLVEAKYRAELQDDCLLGNAEWKIIQRSNGPGRLPLQALQLAVRKARWPDNQPARLGFMEDRPNAPLELWIEKPGDHALTLDWSARGIPLPGGWRFDLRMPACPVLALDLDLPAGDTLIADGDGIRVSGPLPAAAANRSLWHVSLAGVTTTAQVQLPFLVLRPPEKGQPGPLIRYGIAAVQRILASEMECDFDIDLNVSRGGVREFTIELDPGLKPRDVLVPNLEGWDTQPGPAGTTQLLVRMREPLVGGKATIRTLGALPGADIPWTSPSMRVAGGIARGESLQLRIHPAWQLQDWKPGRFRLANVQTASDQFQVLTLQESGLGPENRARPEAKLRPVDAVWDLRQNMDWRIEPEGMTLTIQLSCQVRRGLVFELPVVFPNAWELDQVETLPPDDGMHTQVQSKSGPGLSTLHLEFHQPLSPRAGKTGEPNPFSVTLRFRAPAARLQTTNGGTVVSIPFPRLSVLGARQRDERLAIRLNPAFIGSADTDVPIGAWDGADWPGAAGATRPEFYYSVQGRSLEGTLQLRSRRCRFQARCNSEAMIFAEQWRLLHRLELIPRSGSLQETLVSFSAPLPADSKIQVTNQQAEVRVWEPFPIDSVCRCISVLSSPSAWCALAAAQAPQTAPMNWWRLVLNRPVQEPIALELTCSAPIELGLELPLLLAPNADTFEGQVLVQASPARRWDFRPKELQELRVDSHPRDGFSAAWPRREFQYRSATAALSARPASISQSKNARCEQGTLFLQARTDHHLLALFSFTVVGWEDTSLPVVLPDGARLISVRLNGQDIFVPVSENATVAIPWMPFSVRIRGEIVYELPLPRSHLVAQLDAPSPALPFPVHVQRYWDLPEDLVPVNVDTSWQLLAKNAAPFPALFAEPKNVWESRAGREHTGLVVIRPWLVREMGWLLAILLSGFAIFGLGMRLRWKQAILMAILVIAAGAWIWLPSTLEELALWPVLVLGILVLFRAITSLARRRVNAPASASAVRAHSSVVVSSVILLLILAFTGSTAPPAPTPVYLLPGPPGNPEGGSVLAPPELIDQLQALRQRITPAGAMLLEARYDGRIGDDVVNLEAHYQIHCWGEEKSVVQLPLNGIQLRQALLDGATAWPRSSGQDRLAFDISGSGSHLLTLRFAVPVTGTTEREARFGIPELPISKLTVSAATGVTRLQALSWKGAQQLQMQPEPKLEADLGRIQTVHLLWQAPIKAANTTPIPVQEVHLWDLSETTGRLQSVFRYSLGSQSLSSFDVDVPPELEVAQASVRAIDSRSVSPGQPGLKNWRWEGQGPSRQLHLEMPIPLTGQVQLHLDLLNRQPLGRNPALAVPAAAGSVDRQTFLAYRLQGVQANVLDSRGWDKISEDSFWLKTWLPLRAEPRSARPAQAFARVRDSQGIVRLALVAPPPKGHGEQRLNWIVGPGRAEMSAVARWVDVPVPGLLQWEVPANIHLEEVRAPNLRSWSRIGSRLQIWLDSADQMPVAQGIVVQLSGWLPRPATEADQEKTPFAAPSLWLHGLAEQTAQVLVGAKDGWRLLPQELRGFLPAPDSDLPGYRWSGYAGAPDARAVFHLLPAHGTADANILTSVEVNNRQLQLQAWIDLSVPAAVKSPIPSTVALEIRRGTGWNPQVEVPRGCRLRETRIDPGVTVWMLDLLPGQHLVRVLGRRPLNAADEISLPAISIQALHAQPGTVHSWIAILGRELESLASTGLEASSQSDLPGALPARDKSFSQLWCVTREDWRLRVQPSASALTRPQMLAEFQAAVEPSGAWLQEARYWFLQQSEAEWAITMPDGAHLLSSWLDGQEFISTVSPDRFAAKPGLHFLRLVWATGFTIGDPEPRFESPHLQFGGQAVTSVAVSSTVRRPEGYFVAARSGAPRWSPAARDLHQAAAELALLRSISSQAPSESRKPLQQDIERHLALAENGLNHPLDGFIGESGPSGQPLANWVRQLREQTPAQPSAARDNQSSLPYAAVFDRGEAYSWQGAPEQAGAIRIVPQATGRLWRWFATAALGLFLVLGLWLQKR